jgi:hypothetical protein
VAPPKKVGSFHDAHRLQIYVTRTEILFIIAVCTEIMELRILCTRTFNFLVNPCTQNSSVGHACNLMSRKEQTNKEHLACCTDKRRVASVCHALTHVF